MSHWLLLGSNFDVYFSAAQLQLACLVYILLCFASRAYDDTNSKLTTYQHLQIILLWTLTLVFVRFDTPPNELTVEAKEWLGLWYVTGTLFLLLSRSTLTYAIKILSAETDKNILVLGNNSIIKAISDQIRIEKGKTITGQIEFEELDVNILDEIEQIVRKTDTNELWLCLPLQSTNLVDKIMHRMRNFPVAIRQVPTESDISTKFSKLTLIANIHTIDLFVNPHSGFLHRMKRLEDLVISIPSVVMLAPVLLICAIGVKLSSPGPIIYRQQRHGSDGQPFSVMKFRSMTSNGPEEFIQATKNDPRVTRFGAFLRTSSLDELPQLFNVIQGTMSVVGPRPHPLKLNDEFSQIVDSYMRRHLVKPGITGLAQVNGYRGETDTIEKMRKRIEYDLLYINSWSLWLDIKIIVLTPLQILSKQNAY